LQYGHQSAERKKTTIAPFGPSDEARVCVLPSWSVPEKSGIC